MSIESVIDFLGFPERTQKLLKTHTGEGKIQVKQFEAKGRKRQFIDGDDVVNRLNEAFGHAWSDRILNKYDYDNGEIVVQVEISVTFPNGFKVSHEGFGAGAANNRESVSRGDILKSAHTGAIKAAAKKFGIGLYLEETGSAQGVSSQNKPSYQSDSKYKSFRPTEQKPVVTPPVAELKTEPEPIVPVVTPAPVVNSVPEVTKVEAPVAEAAKDSIFDSDILDLGDFDDPFTSAYTPTKSGGTPKKSFGSNQKPTDAQLNAIHNMSRSIGYVDSRNHAQLIQAALAESDLPDEEKVGPTTIAELNKRQASELISYCSREIEKKKRK